DLVQSNLSTHKHNASHTIGSLKKIGRFSVGPVILPGRFAHNTREDEDDAEEPEVPPAYSSRLLFHLRNTLVTEICGHSAKDNQQWKNSWKLEEEVSQCSADDHDDPSDRIPDRIRKCSEAGIQQKACGHWCNEFEDVCLQRLLINIMQYERKSAHHNASGKDPCNECQHSKRHASAFVADQCECLRR